MLFTLGRALGVWLTAGLGALALAFSSPLLHAQSASGTITGSVVDLSTGKFLEGAEVSVEGTALRTATERQGAFTLRGVPTGSQNVVVSYAGLDPKTSAVNVTAGQVNTLAIQLSNSGIVMLTEFKVAGTKEGMAQAIALQKVSINTKIVAAADQYGDVAEGNAAEYLKFLPGVGVDFNANDARAVTLRGMNTAFTNVTMNGNPIASATSGNLNRRFEFEQVAINNVETVEVFKTLTPEMPATSTGGSINLVSKSAFDRQGSLLTYRTYLQATDTALTLGKTEGWGQEKTRKILPGVDLNYASRLSENLGYNISYKNSQLYNDYRKSAYAWNYSPATGGSPTDPSLTSYTVDNQLKITRRQSISGQVDYRLNESTKVSVQGSWNYYDLDFSDRVLILNPGNRPALASTSTVSFGPSAGYFFGLPGAGNAQLQEGYRWKSGVTWDASAGLTHDFENGAKLEASTYWSQAYSKYRDATGGWYSDINFQRSNLSVNLANVGAIAPNYTVYDSTGAAIDLGNIAPFNLNLVRSRPQTGVDTKYGASLDFKKPFKSSIPVTVKVGTRVDETTRNIENHVFSRGVTPSVTGAAATSLIDTVFATHPVGYGLPAYNFPSVYRSFEQLGGLSFLPWVPASDTIARFVDTSKSAYTRIDVTPVAKLLVVAGVRYESHDTDIQNRLTTLPSIVTAKFKTDKQWFPSINMKYTVTDALLFRFGAAQSIGLPDYSDLLPTGLPTVTDPNGSGGRGAIKIFNPNLKAYNVDNFDAGVEYYFSHSGLLSASIFRKKLTNYIVSSTQGLTTASAAELGIATSSLGAPVDQYDVTYNFNVPDAGYYKGIELAYSQNFSFLPKPFNTIGLQANAAFLGIDPINTNAVFSNSAADPNLNAAILNTINKSLELSSVKRAFNVTLNYSIGKWGFTATSNYTGYVLKTVNRIAVKYTDVPVNQYAFEYQYQAPRELVDVRIDYKWNRKFTPYFEARNIFGRSINTVSQLRPLNRSEFGDPIFEFGVRGIW